MSAALLILSLDSPAEAAVPGKFYEQKQQTVTRDAFARAAKRLAQVEIGMPERQLLEALEMQVLAYRGKPVDALLDGYLPLASRAANDDQPGFRHLVFGYLEGDRENPRIMVVLRDHTVVDVRRLQPSVLAALDATAHR